MKAIGCLEIEVFFFFALFSTFWPHHAPCWISVPQAGIKPTPSAVEEQRLNLRTTREDPWVQKLSLDVSDTTMLCCVQVLLTPRSIFSAQKNGSQPGF